MPYIDYQYYTDEYKGVSIDASTFSSLVVRASDAIDSITRSFYQFNDLETDVAFRKNKFKKAVACQVEYFHEVGSTTTYGMNEPSSVTIGRTSMSEGAKGSQTTSQNTLVSQDAYMYLRDTGLLYRGLGVC
ncbi:MAG: hypothetical protein ABS938_16240 [Psychrobacillus psychrodurans]